MKIRNTKIYRNSGENRSGGESSELADVSVSNLPGSDKFVLAYTNNSKIELIPADSVH